MAGRSWWCVGAGLLSLVRYGEPATLVGSRALTGAISTQHGHYLEVANMRHLATLVSLFLCSSLVAQETPIPMPTREAGTTRQPIQRATVDLPSSSASSARINIEHFPAPSIDDRATVEVHEQPRPRPIIVIRRGDDKVVVGDRMQSQNVQGYREQYQTQQAYQPSQQPVYQRPYLVPQQQPVYIVPQQLPGMSQQQKAFIARLYFHTHYKQCPQLFTFTRPRYVPRRQNDPARESWNQYIWQQYQNR